VTRLEFPNETKTWGMSHAATHPEHDPQKKPVSRQGLDNAGKNGDADQDLKTRKSLLIKGAEGIRRRLWPSCSERTTGGKRHKKGQGAWWQEKKSHPESKKGYPQTRSQEQYAAPRRDG